METGVFNIVAGRFDMKRHLFNIKTGWFDIKQDQFCTETNRFDTEITRFSLKINGIVWPSSLAGTPDPLPNNFNVLPFKTHKAHSPHSTSNIWKLLFRTPIFVSDK